MEAAELHAMWGIEAVISPGRDPYGAFGRNNPIALIGIDRHHPFAGIEQLPPVMGMSENAPSRPHVVAAYNDGPLQTIGMVILRRPDQRR